MSQTNLVPDRSLAFENRVQIQPTRARQTDAPASPFRDVLAGGVSVLMSGAEIATHVLGTPTLAAAVQQAGANATSALSGAGAAAGAMSGLTSRGAVVGTPSTLATATPATTTPGLATSGVSDASDMAQMEAMQRESQVFNLQLLDLQEQVQQENRHFTTISNVLRAKHDTAKAAVSNIRA
jgi:hypothetical protein